MIFDAGIIAPPSADHWLGTDDQARDTLSRIIWGSRVVLTISPLATLCAYVVGCLMGLFAGYYRGWVDTALMQVCNVILSFPVLVLYVIIVMKFGPSPVNIVVRHSASPSAPRAANVGAARARIRRGHQMRGEPAWSSFGEILPNRADRSSSILPAHGLPAITIGILDFRPGLAALIPIGRHDQCQLRLRGRPGAHGPQRPRSRCHRWSSA
jgi:peptide/nickel transport system permease protein